MQPRVDVRTTNRLQTGEDNPPPIRELYHSLTPLCCLFVEGDTSCQYLSRTLDTLLTVLTFIVSMVALVLLTVQTEWFLGTLEVETERYHGNSLTRDHNHPPWAERG